MKKSKIKIVAVSLLLTAILLLLLSLIGEHPYLKLFFTSPKNGKVVFSNIGAEDALEFASDFKEKGEVVKALIAYDYAIKKDPENIDAYTDIARMYSIIGNYKEAKKNIEKAIEKIKPDTLPERAFIAYYGAGGTYFNSINYEGNKSNAKALEYFQKALDISQTIKESDITQYLSDIYFCIGTIYFTDEQYEKAAENTIKSLELEPEDVVLNFRVAISYIELKEFNKADEYLLKLTNAGRELDALTGYIFYYTEKNEMEKTLQYIREAEQKYKGDASLEYYIAHYYERIGNIDKAKEIYTRLFNENPKSIMTSKNQKIITKYNIDVSQIKEKIQKEMEEKYNYKVVKE